MPQAGTPYKLTDVVRANIIQNLERGATIRSAAANAGISLITLQNWRRKGREEDDPEPYRSFYLDTEAAMGRALGVCEHVLWEAAADGDVRAAERFLARRGGDEWRETSAADVSINSKENLTGGQLAVMLINGQLDPMLEGHTNGEV